MARYPPKRDSPQVMIAPEPPKKKDKEEYVLVEPRDFKQAWIDVGLNQCVAHTGPGTDGNRKNYRGLKKELKELQHYLTIKMRGKNIKIKRGASVQKEEACYMPPNADGGYDVRMIINSRMIDGKLHYQVLWEGFPLEFATWEPTSMLSKAKAHVKKFHETFRRKAGDPRRGKHELLDSNESEESEVEMDENGKPKPKPKPKKTKTVPVAEVNSRRMGLGGEAAQAMQLIPAPPRRKRTPGSVEPSRKSARHAPQMFGSLDIHALAAGKVKKTDADEDVDEDETPSFGERKSRCRRGKRAAIGEYASDFDGDENVEMINTLTRASKKPIRRGGKKSVVVDSSSDAGTEGGLPIRKKAKKVAAEASVEVGTAVVDGERPDSGVDVPSTGDDFGNLYNDAMGFDDDDGNQVDNNQVEDEDSDSDSSGDDNTSSESEEE